MLLLRDNVVLSNVESIHAVVVVFHPSVSFIVLELMDFRRVQGQTNVTPTQTLMD